MRALITNSHDILKAGIKIGFAWAADAEPADRAEYYMKKQKLAFSDSGQRDTADIIAICTQEYLQQYPTRASAILKALTRKDQSSPYYTGMLESVVKNIAELKDTSDTAWKQEREANERFLNDMKENIDVPHLDTHEMNDLQNNALKIEQAAIAAEKKAASQRAVKFTPHAW